MPAIVIIGAQWGDEGKGKATDLLASRIDYVVKFNGGNNAGHTVVIGDQKYALHLLPSGILSPGVVPVISNGVVIDIEVLFHELDALIARNVDVSKLLVSANAHVITHYHRTMDKVTERFLGKRQIGTTGRGIGPAYADKINRVGIRIQDLFDENILRQKVEGALHQKNHLLVKIYNRRAIAVDEIVEDLLSYAERLRPMVADTGLVLNQALDAGKTVLFEGGQATMLDVDHGTYPFVTSSNSTSGGASTGSGVAPNRIDRVIGIVKAYTTRVGAGPFPTELLDREGDWAYTAEAGEWLRARGFEFGTTTGRPRRTGWYDAPVARYSARINGVTDYVMTTLDVLTGLETIPVCVAYDVDGVRVEEVPVSQSDFHHAVPIYEEFAGWTEDITGVRKFEDLPQNAQDYVLAIEKISGSRISAIGVGPARDAIVVRHDLIDG
jgi:adenylosuccinate synthase